MIHSSYYQPKIYPQNGDVAPAEIDRAQGIDPTISFNRDKIEEIGRDGEVGNINRSPSVAYRLTQLEYGSFEFWRKLTNQEDTVDTLDLNDFKTAHSDVIAFLTDDSATFKGTLWYPNLRTSGFSINIGDPDALIERSFDLVGEKAKILQGDNKYYIYNRKECESGDTGNVDIDLSSKAPAENPDSTGTYLFKVLRVRGTTTTELTSGTDYTYVNATKTLTVSDCEVGDVIKTYYSSATAPDSLFVLNNSDPAGIVADSASIYLYIPASGSPSSTDYVYRLQSVTLDVRFDREDVKEIGNREVVQRGIRNKTVTVTLGRILEEHTIEEVLRGEGSDYGILDVEKFTDSATLIVKFYTDNEKSTFAYGFKAENLSPTELRSSAGVNAYVNRDDTLECENLTITTDAVELGI